MGDIKLFAKNEKELETLIKAVRIYSEDIGMEFDIEKCKERNYQIRKYQNAQRKGNIQVLGNIGIGHHQTSGDEIIKNLKMYLRRTRKLLETKLYSRNLVKGINTWAVPLVRYARPLLKWTREELQQIDQRTKN